MEKEQLREHVRELKELSFKSNESEYFKSSRLMTKRMFGFPLYQEANKIACFASKKQSHEIHVDDMINHVLSEHKEVFLPKCIPESKDLEFLRIKNLDADTEIAHFSIREPKRILSSQEQEKILRDLDLLLVPGMAFYVKNGKRLGFGSGYYDKFIGKLKLINPKIPIIGLCFDFQIFSDPIPYNQQDSQVDYIISPTRTIQIKKLGTEKLLINDGDHVTVQARKR